MIQAISFLVLLAGANSPQELREIPIIRADENPVVVPLGETKAQTTIRWDSPKDDAEIWVKIDDARERRVSGERKGSSTMSFEVGKKYLYKLYKNDALFKLVRNQYGAKTLATLEVTARMADVNEQPRTPTSGTIPSTVQLPPQTRNFISDVRVVPGTRHVVMTFLNSQKKTPALIEFGPREPVKDRNGIMTFQQGYGAVSRFAVAKESYYELDLQVQNESLEVNTTYYFIINAFNDDPSNTAKPREQYLGKFRTQDQSVKVVWESIHISNDSDPNGSGEIALTAWSNYGLATAKHNLWGEGELTDGETVNVNFVHEIQAAPDTLILELCGRDHDGIGSGSFIATDYYTYGPGDNGDYEWNSGRLEFDLNDYPGDGVRVPFEVRSMPNGGEKGDLQFEGKGYFIITRKAVGPAAPIGTRVGAIIAPPVWSNWFRITDGGGLKAPITAIQPRPGHIDLFVTGNDGYIYSTYHEAAGGWRKWFKMGDLQVPRESKITALATRPDHVDLFVKGNLGRVYSTYFEPNGGWRPWFPIPGMGGRKPGSNVAAVQPRPGHIDLFTVGQDGRVMSTYFEAQGGWRAWFPIHEMTAAGFSEITALVTTRKQIQLYVSGIEGGVYMSLHSNSGNWTQWSRIGSMDMKPGSPITAIETTPDHIDLFAVNSKSEVVSTYDGKPWFRVTNMGAVPGTKVEAMAIRPGHLDLFVVGMDGGVYSTFHEGQVGWRTWFKVTNMTSTPGAAVTALATRPGHVDLFVSGVDSGVYSANHK